MNLQSWLERKLLPVDTATFLTTLYFMTDDFTKSCIVPGPKPEPETSLSQRGHHAVTLCYNPG